MCASNSSNSAKPTAHPLATVHLRLATIDDRVQMADLLTQLGYPMDADRVATQMEAILKRDDYRIGVAQGPDGIFGLIYACWGLQLEQTGRWGHILALVVDESCRGKGIGSRLLNWAEAWLRSVKVTRIIVNSHQRRSAAHQFYLQRGYQMTGFRFVRYHPFNTGPSEA